ncbi:hypothetical protein SCUCBS95973_003244 [Sporothrix curviconia]|uniref:Protein kinase domain-containing protein n=1 Tax=Sporothrix curviconia TaxID=1260050 RepID=A0ABP0BEX1_9PEZI
MHDLATLRAGGYRDAGLTKLKLTETLDQFPSEIFNASIATTLEILDLSGTGLSALPADLGARLPRLRIAFFSNCNFTTFPSTALAGCPRLEMVAFRKNGMEAFEGASERASQDDSVAIFPPQLRWLILTDNRLAHIPASIGRCARLEKCMLAGNQLTGLPDAMARCQNLTLLRLAANRLEALPGWLLSMPRLAFLSFAGNPCSAANALSSAKDTAAPATSASQSTLPHVDWNQIEMHHVLGEGASGIISKGTIRSTIGGSGNAGTAASSRGPSSALNSCGPSGFNTPSLSGTSTPALSVSSGASSVFSTATSSLSALSATTSASAGTNPSSSTLSPSPSLSLSPSTPVAVKIFRGALTSDGTPYDEMAACMAAGQHVNLVQVHGQIRWGEDEEEDAEEAIEANETKEAAPASFRGGLIMELIPPQYRVLGQPPSFDSCTRDCFDTASDNSHLPVPAAMAILSGVASAAAHLHARGIAHGDLYAHNILVARAVDANTADAATHAILSDFGAATLYGSTGLESLEKLEKLEVLAFAHLVEDVVGLMAEEPSSIRQQLLRLHEQCAVQDVTKRPAFSTLVRELSALQAVA